MREDGPDYVEKTWGLWMVGIVPDATLLNHFMSEIAKSPEYEGMQIKTLMITRRPEYYDPNHPLAQRAFTAVKAYLEPITK